MLNKKGLTLVEIIIALAILGIVSVSILTGFSSYFSMIVKTKDITKDVFKTQQNMELEIQSIKNKVLAGSMTEVPVKYTLFEGIYKREVKGYPREKIILNNRSIHTIVADIRMPEFEVAKVSDVVIDLWDSISSLKHAYSSTTSLGIRSGVPVITDPNNVNLMNLHKWYVSKSGFNIPMIDSPEEIENGVKYPRFPDDYDIIPNETTKNLNAILPSYGDRHVLYTITPAAKSGKMGETVPSKPLFISGLPVIDKLILHLNSSYINKQKTDEVRIVNSNEIYANKWIDLSPSKNDATQVTSNTQPQLTESIFNANQWGKSLNGNAGVNMKINNFYPNTTTDLSVIVVAKINQNQAGSPYNSIIGSDSGSWGFGWTSDGSLSYYCRDKNGNDYTYASQNKSPDSNWHVFTGIISNKVIKFRVDGNEVSENNSPPSIISTGPVVKINWQPYLEIGEVLMYNRDISAPAGDIVKIEDYLSNKYKPTVQE